MDERSPINFKRARRRLLLFDFVFLVAALGMVADVYYLDRVSVPTAIPLYGFPVIFAVIMLTYPVKAYVMTRWLRRWTDGTEKDSSGGLPVWKRIF